MAKPKSDSDSERVDKITPFTFINSICEKNRLSPEVIEEHYNPFIINRYFSFFPDTVHFANELNRYGLDYYQGLSLSKQQQYDFYYAVLPKRKRFTRWFKQDLEKQIQTMIELIQARYLCSKSKAREIVSIFKQQPDAFVEFLNVSLKKGGKK